MSVYRTQHHWGGYCARGSFHDMFLTNRDGMAFLDLCYVYHRTVVDGPLRVRIRIPHYEEPYIQGQLGEHATMSHLAMSDFEWLKF